VKSDSACWSMGANSADPRKVIERKQVFSSRLTTVLSEQKLAFLPRTGNLRNEKYDFILIGNEKNLSQ
jgi:hypothetical protein